MISRSKDLKVAKFEAFLEAFLEAFCFCLIKSNIHISINNYVVLKCDIKNKIFNGSKVVSN